MMLTEETTVQDAALPVPEFRAHLRLGTGFAEDGLQDGVLRGFLRAAIHAIEGRTGKTLIARDFTWILSRWQDGARQPFPTAPVVALTAVSLILPDQSETAVDLSRLRVEPDGQRPVLCAVGGVLPMIPGGGSVRIGFAAGMADDWGGLPADLAQAVLMLAAHYYEFRHETSLGEGCMPFGVTSLIQRYRTVRLTPGAVA